MGSIMFERKKYANHWEGRIEPFRIIGNVYFVGTYPASSHLIDTGAGLILIDTGYADTLFMVVDSIHRLGFDPMDIKYIINTHWHGDHTAGTAALAGLTGAKTLIGEKDAEKAKQYFAPDILVRDGDTLMLGNTTITFMETPGHTKGTVPSSFIRRRAEKFTGWDPSVVQEPIPWPRESSTTKVAGRTTGHRYAG